MRQYPSTDQLAFPDTRVPAELNSRILNPVGFPESTKSYNAVTGVRNLGDIFNNPALRKYLPADMKRVYDASQAGGYRGISGTVDEILKLEALSGSTKDQMRQINERSRRNAATAKLVGYQMDNGHHGAVAELPEGGIVESPRSSLEQLIAGELSGVMTADTAAGGELKSKVMDAPKHAQPDGVEGAQTA